MLERAKRLKSLINKYNPECLIEVDGGVSDENIQSLKDVGVDVVVAGSFVYKHKDGVSKAISLIK